jgi:hypothetical protein
LKPSSAQKKGPAQLRAGPQGETTESPTNHMTRLDARSRVDWRQARVQETLQSAGFLHSHGELRR